ncbi:ABC transporter ATP-binding protein [Nocardioides sp. JQ2195]|uniref:ABC transporter ATP-binding protein n=1 Tax=Nocardioides sp. JQ2195 TaxID=2592334 RepID=UPI00143E7FA9|nr:ABC transporter ATP-binding protein [Nocardioides sp. JQ2195]QIX28204.1 ABC transporter ATP-binding protein [Nocardioides sp. JQ2195]
MLVLENVRVAYGRNLAVDDVTLELPRGQVLAVLGPSGCGKSTLLRAVAGLERLSAGTISYDGADLAGVPTHKRGFALMFQDGQLFGHRSVGDNVAYPLRIRHRSRSQTSRRVEELLELVGLAGFADRQPATLSGGERQRVALARALAVEPRLLLLDEPLSALDRSLRERLAVDLREILTRAGTTALLVTHDHEEAFAVADRMALMRAGRLVQEGALVDVWEHPVDAEAAKFLGYPTVLSGEAARVILHAAGLDSAGQVALRRSALRVREQGPLSGSVLASRVTPDAVRLEVDVPGVGVVAAVTSEGVAAPGPGATVRLEVARDRLAVVPEAGPRPRFP